MFGEKYYLIRTYNPIIQIFYVILGFLLLFAAQVVFPVAICITILLFICQFFDLKYWHKIKYNGNLDLIFATSGFKLTIYLTLFFIFCIVPLLFLASATGNGRDFESWITEDISFLTWWGIGFLILFSYIYMVKKINRKKFSHYKRKKVIERQKSREQIVKAKKQINAFAHNISKYYFK